MESSLRHEIKVGIFAAIGLVLFCVSVIMLGGDKLFFKKTYELKARLSQVQGLGRGSVVSVIGVPVGNVTEITFVPGSTDVQVHMDIEYGMRERITEGSKASVKTQGALGDKYIYIEPGPPDARALNDGALLETDKTPDLFDLISSKGAELGEVVLIVKEMRLLFENLNRDGKSAKLMGNLVTTTDNLSSFLVEARETFKLLRTEAIAPTSSVMKKIDKGQGTLGALVNDPSLHNRLSGFFGESPRNKFLKPLIRDSIQTNESKGK